ncbi:MAG: N-acetylglucosamine-6-phosphate deacetylase [Albidovulum sp.]
MAPLKGSASPPEGWLSALAGAGAWIVPDLVFDGQHLKSGHAVQLKNGRARVVKAAAVLAEGGADLSVWRPQGIISPGFFDIQVNGGGGVMFNTSPSVKGIRAIALAHRSTGTTRLLPTVITDHPEVLENASVAIAEAAGQDGVMGIHIEGPHISAARRGTHAAQYIRALDARTLEVIARLRAGGTPVMITLAPEAVVPGQIAALVDQGVIVALGHSDASAKQTQAALSEGAQSFTHLFNAMSQIQNREAGVTGAAINSSAYCSMIADGIHVAPEMLALAIRARPQADRMILVSDAMPTVAGPESFELYGKTIRLQDGRLINDEGALAGAHVTMAASLSFVVNSLGVQPEAALRMAISNPARLMGLDQACCLEGMPAGDVVLIANDFSSLRFVAS